MTAPIDMATLLLAGLLGMVVGGNNLAACSGTVIGSGIVSKRSGILMAVAGYVLGLSVEGPKLFRVREAFLPNETMVEVFTILFVTLLVFLGGEVGKVPLSLSTALTGAIVGVSLGSGAFQQPTYLVLIVGFWVLAPLAATALGVMLIALDDRYSPKNLWLKLSIFRAGLLIMAFFAAYVSGSNTLGLIAGVPYKESTTPAISVGIGSVIGAFIFGRGALRRLTEGIFSLRYPNAFFSQLLGTGTVELAIQLGIPLSTTETVSSGIIGSGFAKKMRVLNIRNISLIVVSWIVSPAAGLLAGYLLIQVLA